MGSDDRAREHLRIDYGAFASTHALSPRTHPSLAAKDARRRPLGEPMMHRRELENWKPGDLRAILRFPDFHFATPSTAQDNRTRGVRNRMRQNAFAGARRTASVALSVPASRPKAVAGTLEREGQAE